MLVLNAKIPILRHRKRLPREICPVAVRSIRPVSAIEDAFNFDDAEMPADIALKNAMRRFGFPTKS
jgi:hypothetical protein